MRRIFLIVAFGIIAIPGCGSSEVLPETAPVSGTVTLGGVPLTNGTVTFHPEGEGNPGYGEIKEDGTFELTTYELKDGAVLGRHIVTVEVFQGATPEESPLPGSEQELSIVPAKYASPDTSPLRFEVKAGKNTAPLPLEL